MKEKTYMKIKSKDEYGLVTQELCEKMEEMVRDSAPLALFYYVCGLNQQIYFYYLEYVLPMLFSTEELNAYFLDVLIKKQSVVETWEVPNKENNMLYIFRLNTHQTSDFTVINDVYEYVMDNLFTLDMQYPRVLRDEVVRCFKCKLPMPHTYKMFSDLYKKKADGKYRSFIAYIFCCFGDDRITEYFDTVIKDYVSKLDDYQKGYVYIQDIMAHLFGSYFNHAVFCCEVRNKSEEELSKSYKYRMNKIFMRTAWPYICLNFMRKTQTAYKVMGLTDKEIEEYDKKLYSMKRYNIETIKTYALTDIEKITFPNGSTYEDVQQWVETLFEQEVAPTRTVPTKEAIYEYIRHSEITPIIQDLRHMIENTLLRRKLSQCIDDVGNQFKERYLRENEAEIMSDKQCIILYFRAKEVCAMRKLDSSAIKPPLLQKEFLMYRREMLLVKKGVTTKSIQDLNKAVVVLAEMTEKFGIEKCADIKKTHILLYLHEMQINDYAPMTVCMTFGIINLFIKTIQNQKDYEFAPTVNPAKNIHFSTPRMFVKSRPVIPEDILVFIDENLWELDEDVRLIYMLLRTTLWRFGDVANLRVDGISEIDDEGYASIRTETGKTKAALRKHNCSDKFEDVIPYELYKQLQDYIKATEPARKAFGTDLVFFQGKYNLAHAVSPSRLNGSINWLLAKHGISSIDETYSRFSASQTRTTGATFLIEASEGLPIVQRKLGHLNRETTERHYARVRKEKLAELDKKFFDRKFSDLLDDEKRALMTEEKRQELYQDFSSKLTSVEFGECELPLCSEKCKSHGTVECATCPKLITGPQYLYTWKKLKVSSDKRIEELEDIYRERGIDKEVYDTFSEYQAEIRRSAAYKAVVDRIMEYENTETD